MSETKPNNIFRWRVLILDDYPKDKVIQNSLESCSGDELEAFALGEVGDFANFGAENGANWLWGSDIALIDMKWGTLGRDAPQPFLPDADSCNLMKAESLKAFIAQWIDSVRSACAIPPCDARKPNAAAGKKWAETPWPRSRIEDNEVGLWLAALLTHVNPDGQRVLYSSYPNIRDEGSLAALGRFRDLSFRLITKPPESGVFSMGAFETPLRRCQEHLLESNRIVRDWFIRNVMLIAVAGDTGSPIEGGQAETVCLYDKLKRKGINKELRLDYVFPQIREKPWREGFDILKSFIRRETLSLWQRESLINQVEHNMRPWNVVAPDDAQLAKMAALCREIGGMGLRFSDRLQSIMHLQDPSKREEMRSAAWETLWSSLCDGYCGVKSVVALHNPQRREWTQRFPKSSPEANPITEKARAGKTLLLDILEFDCVVAALVHNAGGAAYSIDAEVAIDSVLPAQTESSKTCNARTLVVTYVDQSQGFADGHALANALIKSLEKGEDRGLPLAFLFGLRENARDIEILRGRRWRSLLRPGFDKDGPGGEWRFGIRWEFAMPEED